MLEIRGIHKSFGPGQTALERIDLTIQEGEFFSLLGPSGCGKSTLLRILAGLEEATSGEIYWKGQRIDQMPARERPFNMVFQKYALFPHLSVSENVAFGLKIKGTPANELKNRVDEALSLVNLGGYESRLPETLSGGQQQRVALARALINRPSIVLLDEPLGALDQKLRERMQSELRLLQRRLGLTFIFVTHDQEEAMILSDRVAVMNEGRLEQVSAPRELFEKPSSLFSARFVGGRNELTGRLTKAGAFESNGKNLEGVSRCSELDKRGAGAKVSAFVRPEMVRVSKGAGTLEGRIEQILFRGSTSEVMIVGADGSILRAVMDPAEASQYPIGTLVALQFPASETHLFWSGPEQGQAQE